MTQSTHEVLNQPPPLEGRDLFASDTILQEALEREGGGWAREKVASFGKLAGSVEVFRWGFQANENPPVLKTHDRFGHRIDEVEYHPAWHQLMQTSIENGLQGLPWNEKRPGVHVVRAAMYAMLSQIEQGHFCPITMTFACVPTIRMNPRLARDWEPKILSNGYDPSSRPITEKKGATVGMAMTEKQGGSDVRANTTRAVSIGGDEYLLTGHKWFCSAPMSDAFLVLAQAPKGLSCFLLPRWKPDGTKNAFLIQRLKNKLGNRSNASSEVEFVEAWASLVGEEGRGVPAIIQMVNHTRLDCVIGSTSIMRQALSQALHHSSHRMAFGKRLIDQSLMKNVLADLTLEVEAAMVLMMRLARAYDEGSEETSEGLFKRIGTAISKYWVCKRAPVLINEAMECLGGAGYVEESILPRLFREAPLNSIWEGSGNVNTLDVLRALRQEPSVFEALLDEIGGAAGADPSLDRLVLSLKERRSAKGFEDEAGARAFVEGCVLALQASLLFRHSPPFVAEAFCRSRIASEGGRCFGTLPHGVDFDRIIKRASPIC